MAEKYKVTREQLAESFQELVDEELKKFKSKLTYIKMKKKINNIPRAKVMKADNEDLAEILVQHYGSDYAVKVVLKALKKINKRSLAEILLHEFKGESKPQTCRWSCCCPSYASKLNGNFTYSPVYFLYLATFNISFPENLYKRLLQQALTFLSLSFTIPRTVSDFGNDQIIYG